MNKNIYYKLQMILNKELYENEYIPYEIYLNAEEKILKELEK